MQLLPRIEPVEDRPDLHADHDEGEHVEDENRGLPHGVSGNAQCAPACGSAPSTRSSWHKTTSVRIADRPISSARIQTPNVERTANDRHRRVAMRCEHAQRNPTEQITGNEAAGTANGERADDLAERERRRRDRAEREPVDQQRGRIVEQALAFENRSEPMRRPQLAHDRRRGGRIRRRDDGAERDRGAPTACPARSRAPRAQRRPSLAQQR